MKKRLDKYAYYEEAVQTPEQHTAMFALIYSEIRGKHARSLREDFCGTFLISREWVKRDPKNFAICIDYDSKPLRYGRKHHTRELKSSQKKRLYILNEDVMSVTTPKVDVEIACNFSFFIYKERSELLGYFRCARKSVNPGGLFILEIAGGPGMIEKTKEQQTVADKQTGKYTYVWDQKHFNPITHDSRYSIHFKFPDGSWMKDAFTYDWRLWTIPEVRDVLKDAGFRHTHVYWEISKKGRGTGDYGRTERGENAYSWIAYVVGENR